QTLRTQFLLGRGEPVAFQHAFALSRSDTRDLPDGMAAKLLDESETPDSLVFVSATTRDRDEAIDLAGFAAGFCRDVLVWHELRDLVGTLAGTSAREIAAAQSRRIALQQDVESLTRRIEALREIREEYGTQLGQVVGGTQVQVEGARFLSPVQQLVALE